MPRKKQSIDTELEALLADSPGVGEGLSMDALMQMLGPRYNTLVELGGQAIDLAAIRRIDRGRRFVESQLGNSRWQFSIELNRDINTTEGIPYKDVEIWYEKEETRDLEYRTLIDTLKNNGRTIVTRYPSGDTSNPTIFASNNYF